jgi:hypothetical protein
MAGQEKWSPAGTGTNDYIINPRLSKQIYLKSEYATLFGKMNGGRMVEETVLEHGKKKIKIDVGNDSPVWEKNFDDGGDEFRFTTLEATRGMPTYGDVDLEPGDFDEFMHSVCNVRNVHSPRYPIPGKESQMLVKGVIDDYVKLKKMGIARWREKQVDLDAWRALLMGFSRGLALTSAGARGVTPYGGTAGQVRSCYNTYVAGESGLSSASATLATHESTLATLLQNLSDDDAYEFNYESTRRISTYIEDLDFKPTKVGGREVRAVVFTDRRNLSRLDADSTYENKLRYARERSAKNPSLYHMDEIYLDEILYVPVRQLKYFRPSTDGSTVTYGCGHTLDPLSKTFNNTSNITLTIVCGAGALLRGRRSGVDVTVEKGAHNQGADYAVHYADGWSRREMFTKDGRTEMDNDSTLVMFNYDPGQHTAYAA